MRFAPLTTLLLGAVLRVTAQTADPAKVADIIAQLQDIPTTAARFNTFNGREFVFDFNQGVGVTGGAGGNITVANVADFPYLLGKGMALTVGKLAPCGMASPHYHPRAAEFLYMLSGTSLQVGFILENGARLVSGLLVPNQAFVFPQNSFHYQVNLGCDPVTFVAGLNHEDPGVATVGQRFFGIPPNVTDVTIGNIGVNEVVRIAQSIPDTFAIGLQSCLDKCKIQRGPQPKTQQQPRVLGNGFPTNTTSKRDSESNVNKRSESPQEHTAPAFTIPSLLASANPQTLEEIAFLLKAVICVLLSGYLFAWFYFVLPALRNRNRRTQAELQARAAPPPSVPVQDVKA